MACPFCGFEAVAEYEMLLHVETFHAEGQSPFVATDGPDVRGQDRQGQDLYANCPVDGCGEVILAAEMHDHLELHAEEEAGDESTVEEPSHPPPDLAETRHSQNDAHHKASRVSSPRASAGAEKRRTTIQQWKELFARSAQKGAGRSESGPGQQERRRLGKSELGRYADEKTMPEWLVSLLRKEGEIKASGIVPVVEELLRQSAVTEFAYFCDPCVQHISKLKREGGFCGYRNIQMMVSYIVGANAFGADHFGGKIPSIFKIQDFIETAWDHGINARGRIETGGIRGTRKYIGTPEAQAVFCSLGIPCEVQAFKDPEPGKSQSLLFDAILNYFSGGFANAHAKVMQTSLPPIYFQHPGHSLTIIGIEKMKHSGFNLLVFDPMFHDSTAITRLVARKFDHKHPDGVLAPYRRGLKYLRKYREFEVLRLPQPHLNLADET